MAALAVNTVTYEFDGKTIAVTYTTGAPSRGVETNIGYLTQEQMSHRFFADMIKDTNTKDSRITPVGCDTFLRSIYSDYYPEDSLSNYTQVLRQLEDALYNEPDIIANTTILKNILKTSTVGSNTKISYADYVFFESGFGADMICANDEITLYGTPASDLDSATKQGNQQYFPYFNITFGKTFTERFGFPNTLWMWDVTTGQVIIEYTDGSTITGSTGKSSLFRLYTKGNREKNLDLEKYFQKQLSDVDISVIYKILETKELGDVAQVWVYLAFVVENEDTDRYFDRTKAVMITTDSVVYLLCVLLHLSCVYTGAREGVTSGGCTLKHYLAGVVNYDNKVRTLIINEYERVIQYVRGQIFAFKLIIMDGTLDKYSYLRLERGKLRKTYGSQVREDVKPAIIAELKKGQAQYETYESDIDTIYNQAITAITTYPPTNDAAVTYYFSKFQSALTQYKMSPVFTKLSRKDYLLNPCQLLTHIATLSTHTVPLVASDIDQVLAQSISGGRGKSSSSNPMKKKKIIGGTRTLNNTSFTECIIITHIFSLFGYRYDAYQGFPSNENTHAMFSMKYDNLVHQINTDEDSCGKLHFYHQTLAAKGMKDETIEKIGLHFANFMYFADDIYDETGKLEAEVNAIVKANWMPQRLTQMTLRMYSQQPQFEPRTVCDRSLDPFTNEKIPNGYGTTVQDINGGTYLCISAHTVVSKILENILVKDFRETADIFTFDKFYMTPVEQQNIINFIYHYYFTLYQTFGKLGILHGLFSSGYRVALVTGGKGRSFQKKYIANNKIKKNTRKKKNNKNNKSKKKCD